MPATNKFNIGDEVYFPNSKSGDKLYARRGFVKEVYENKLEKIFMYVIDVTDLGEVHAFEETIEKTHKIDYSSVYGKTYCYSPKIIINSIDHVLFNPPATIIFWNDKTKTVVKCKPNEEFDPEKGLAMAITKKALGNKYDYYDVFWKFLPKEYKKALKKKKEFEPCEAGYDETEIMCHTCPEKEACEEMVKEFLSKSKGLKEIINGQH